MSIKKSVTALVTAAAMLLLSGCSLSTDTLKAKAEELLNGSSSGAGNYSFSAENYPAISVSPTLLVTGEAITSAVLSVTQSEASSFVKTASVTENYRRLCAGEVSFVLTGETGEEAQKYIRKTGEELEITKIGTDALVFFCSADNTVDSLTQAEIKKIFSGDIASWREVGGADRAIDVYQRAQGSDSRMLFDTLIKTGGKGSVAKKDVITEPEGEIFEAEADYVNTAGSIGYSGYLYMTNIGKGEHRNIKILSVDGVEPNGETISDGTYPLTGGIYAAIRKSAAKNSPERILFNWICSSQGREFIKAE